MDVTPFLASIEKVGMFAIAGYLVHYMVNHTNDLSAYLKTIIGQFSEQHKENLSMQRQQIEVQTRLETKLDRTLTVIEQAEQERAALTRALSSVRKGQDGYIQLSMAAILGLAVLAGLLYYHSEVLSERLDAEKAQRSTLQGSYDAIVTHERELNASLAAREQTINNLRGQMARDVRGIRNAQPNDCSDAPTAPDILRVWNAGASAPDSGSPSPGGDGHSDTGTDMRPRDESRDGRVRRVDARGFAGM